MAGRQARTLGPGRRVRLVVLVFYGRVAGSAFLRGAQDRRWQRPPGQGRSRAGQPAV